MRYRQEYYAGEAEDQAEIVSLREQVEVPLGYFRPGRVLMTRDLNPLDPRCSSTSSTPEVSDLCTVGVSGGDDREELVRYTRGKAEVKSKRPPPTGKEELGSDWQSRPRWLVPTGARDVPSMRSGWSRRVARAPEQVECGRCCFT